MTALDRTMEVRPMAHDKTGDTAETIPQETPPVRYWPDGTQVTLEVEAALDRIVATVKRVQANHRDSG
ncbi:hypothetical protein CA984_16430 [Streptosporangium minutum]|uniref:Uncharacterized protein n=2 Tax=Streptosporangiaceae TaxID=2004 RepID=A0A243RM89_9ACTN|nr:hypothetical protein CA984_16430 [Streptosporangium minutum]